MLYNDCIEFSVSSWVQTHTIECWQGKGSPNITLKGKCGWIPVTCGLWINLAPFGDSDWYKSQGFFRIAGKAESLESLKFSAKSILMDVHMPSGMYDRILDTMNCELQHQRTLVFSAYYRILENMQKEEESWFDVVKFEVTESAASPRTTSHDRKRFSRKKMRGGISTLDD